VHDFVALDADGPGTEPGVGVGVITHGHHTDGWNAPHRAGLGKFGTWTGSAILDTPKVANPGVPDLMETGRLLAGRAPNVLTAVGRRLGANRELYSLDEVLLHRSWRQRWPVASASSDAVDEPWLLLGHTHVPLSEPRDVATGDVWTRYANSGAGIFYECLTGIEWDGTRDPRHPDVRVVVWRYADLEPASDAEVIAQVGDRAVVREVLARDGDDDHLAVVRAGADSSTVPR